MTKITFKVNRRAVAGVNGIGINGIGIVVFGGGFGNAGNGETVEIVARKVGIVVTVGLPLVVVMRSHIEIGLMRVNI